MDAKWESQREVNKVNTISPIENFFLNLKWKRRHLLMRNIKMQHIINLKPFTLFILITVLTKVTWFHLVSSQLTDPKNKATELYRVQQNIH